MLISALNVRAEEEPVFSEEYEEKINSLMDQMEESSLTVEGLDAAEEVIVTAREAGDRMHMYYGITTKMTIYSTLAEYKTLNAYIDSIDSEYDMKAEYPYFYYYMTYLKTLSFIEQGKYKLAIQEAKKLYDDSKNEGAEEEEDDDSIPQYIRNRCNALTCLGLANRAMGQTDKAIEYFDECIEICRQNKSIMLPIMMDVQSYKMEAAQSFDDKKQSLKILDEFKKEIDQFEEDKSKTVSFASISTGSYQLQMHVWYVDAYCKLENTQAAREHLEAAQRVMDEYDLHEDDSMAELYTAKAKYYSLISQNQMAVMYADSAAMFFQQMLKPSVEVEILKIKLDAMHNAKMYQDEYDVSRRIMHLSDSLYIQQSNSQIEEMGTIMNVDKLNNEKKTLAAQRQLALAISATVVLLALIVIIYLNYRKGQEKQKILSQQKELLEAEVARQTSELREQKNEIEQKNRDITDSINYAQRIQSSILPDLEQYKNYGIEGAFAFFIPCNIVSGDFYWATKHGDNIVIACSDCTGHGVPGAFVSMIGSTSLNEISSNPVLLEPGEMLEELDKNVFKVLGQSGGEARDGMDIALMSYNPSTRKVKAAGAKRPVYLIHADGTLEEFKGTKRSIGDTDEMSRAKTFETLEFEVQPGDTLYMCSDGLGDQFGGQEQHGPNGKRLMSGGLKRMLQRICQEDITKQRDMAEQLYWEWRGTCPQLDDISLVGVRF